MSETIRMMNCSPQTVFDVLSDGWTYASWVVGAARIRKVDADFPKAGSKVHHSVGAWPFMISDETEVEEVDEPRELQLRVAAWPAGEGRVRVVLEPVGEKTRVTMHEKAISGPAKFIPKPAQDVMLNLRNTEALKRLAYLAEGNARSEMPNT